MPEYHRVGKTPFPIFWARHGGGVAAATLTKSGGKCPNSGEGEGVSLGPLRLPVRLGGREGGF